MRARGRTDSNQTDVVQAMRTAGITVQILSAVGSGCPDLLCGFRGVNVLVELKDGAKVDSKQELTFAEKVWHETWGGQCCVATSAEEAVTAVIAAVKALERV
jgi:hypothetical protein